MFFNVEMEADCARLEAETKFRYHTKRPYALPRVEQNLAQHEPEKCVAENSVSKLSLPVRTLSYRTEAACTNVSCVQS